MADLIWTSYNSNLYSSADSSAAGNSSTITCDSNTTASNNSFTIYYQPMTYQMTECNSVTTPETEEQRVTRLEAQKVYDLERELRHKEQEQARIKAEVLLKEHIGLEAFGKLHQVGYIEVDSQKYAGRKYRVPSQERNLIEVVDEQGKVIDKLCVHPIEQFPAADEVLARIILLQFAEEHILKVANHDCAHG